MRFLNSVLALAALVLSVAGPAPAADSPPLLAISGRIEAAGPDGRLLLHRSTFEAMRMTVVKTETPWTVGVVTFEGVALKDLLDLARVRGKVIHAIALNDYAVDIPVEDAANANVIVAYRMNGQTMRVRDKGPLWLIYPLSEEPSLRTEATYSKMIWQIKTLEIR